MGPDAAIATPRSCHSLVSEVGATSGGVWRTCVRPVPGAMATPAHERTPSTVRHRMASSDATAVPDGVGRYPAVRRAAVAGVGNSSGSIGISTIAGLPHVSAARTASPTWSGCST